MSKIERNKVKQKIINDLKSGNNTEAVRKFLEARLKGLFPKGGDVIKWLTNNFGKKNANLLVNSFVHIPCNFCKQGLVLCENCGGKGHFDHELICDTCFGLGITCCEFCGSTGWSPMDSVAKGLKLTVFAERAKIAREHIRHIEKSFRFKPSQKNANEIFKKCVQAFFDLNRQMSILEETVVKSGKYGKSNRTSRQLISDIKRKCVLTSIKGFKEFIDIFKMMILTSRLESEDTTIEPKQRWFANKRTEFLEALITSDTPLEGTPMEHSLLKLALRRMISKKQKK